MLQSVVDGWLGQRENASLVECILQLLSSDKVQYQRADSVRGIKGNPMTVAV
jgi:hypothetical protein